VLSSFHLSLFITSGVMVRVVERDGAEVAFQPYDLLHDLTHELQHLLRDLGKDKDCP
jgi:hypothetical protein